MKQLKSVFAVALMSVMFANVATAQTTTVQSKPIAATLTAEECKAYTDYLTTHTAKDMGLEEGDFELFKQLFATNNEPLFATVEKAGLVAGRSYAAGDSLGIYIIRDGILKLFSYPIRSNAVAAAAAAAVDAKLKLAAARAWAVEELNEGRPRYRTEIVADLSNGEQVTIPEKAMNKFGLSAVFGANYQGGAGLNSFSGEGGFSYSISNRTGKLFVMPQILASLRQTKFNDNSTRPGEKMTSYGTEAMVYGGASFGKHGEWRFSLGAGADWEFYKTDSQPRYYEDGSWDEMSSEGNDLNPVFKFQMEWDGYNKPFSLFAGLGTRQHSSVWQNNGSKKDWLVLCEVGVKGKLFRHVTNNK